MKLHGSIASPYVARVVMCARAKGIALVPEAMPGSGVADPLPSPLGGMPVLEVDGESIAEADAICEYLEDAYPERTLRPKDLHERARARLLTRILDLHCLAPLGPLLGARAHRADPATRATVREQTLQALQAGLEHLDRSMGPGPYAVGSALTLADCALLPGIAFLNFTIIAAFRLPNPTTALPRLRDWWQQMGEDPLCVQVLEEWTMAHQQARTGQIPA